MTTTRRQDASATLTQACALLDQCHEFLGALDAEQYTLPSSRMMGSTIGQHVRHTLDHYAAALTALSGEIIDYDHRQRDTPVENDLEVALDTVVKLRTDLERVPEGKLGDVVRLRVMLDAEGSEIELGSTLARELAFSTHHAIHHCAMIASIAWEQGVGCPEGFGKAPSTRNYERTKANIH